MIYNQKKDYTHYRKNLPPEDERVCPFSRAEIPVDGKYVLIVTKLQSGKDKTRPLSAICQQLTLCWQIAAHVLAKCQHMGSLVGVTPKPFTRM